jgi:hypothetical protein
MVNEIIAAIGNVVEAVEINGVLFTLSADAVIRTNDADEGEMIARINYPTLAAAKAVYDYQIAIAKKVSR